MASLPQGVRGGVIQSHASCTKCVVITKDSSLLMQKIVTKRLMHTLNTWIHICNLSTPLAYNNSKHTPNNIMCMLILPDLPCIYLQWDYASVFQLCIIVFSVIGVYVYVYVQDMRLRAPPY